MVLKSENEHDVVKYSELNKTKEENCLTHPKQQCCAFCSTCDIPICLLCVSIKHRTHEIMELSEKADDLSDFISKENERLQSMESELENFLDHTSKKIEGLPQVYQQSKDDVTTQARKWHKEIERTKKKIHEDLDKMQEKNIALLLMQKTEFEKILKKLKNLKRSAFNLSKSKDVSGLMKLKVDLENLKIPSSEEKTQTAYFQPCKLDENYIATHFGYINIETFESYKLSIDDSEDKVQSQRQSLDVPTVLFTFDTGFPADKSSGHRLNSIVPLGEDRVWTGGHSNELKLFDFQGRLLDTITISALGYYLTLYDGHIVYSDPKNHTVMKIINREVDTLFHTGEFQPQGITCTIAGNLLVCLCTSGKKESKIVRYSTSGEVIHEIQHDSQHQPLFSYAVHVVENGNDICVADWGKEALIVVDKYGVFRFSYSGNRASKYKFHATSITTDSMHHIIITDAHNDKIHMLKRNGQFLRYIIPYLGINGPVAVCVLKERELMVGEFDTGKVKRIEY
ncbi:uncharacterized protein LOC133182895 [Saccostrea echinata]|uniref:uncharacterized protein LOC133182895 n=1 Tax=Saccostrea echinata TaxID=191078 RepID=UPI002A817012|nr:uncharacterized protein LOC133182895 [Saccostrea echinata]